MSSPASIFSQDDQGPEYLFPAHEMEQLHEAAPDLARHEHTGANFLSCHPKAAEIILNLAGLGMSGSTICKVTRVHHRTVANLIDRFPEKVDAAKKKLSSLAGQVAIMSFEAARDRLMAGDLGKTSLKDLVISAAAATDKRQLLEGEATHRVEIQERDYRPDYMRQLEGADAGAPPYTHCLPENIPAKAAASPGPEDQSGSEADGDDAKQASRDGSSDV